MWNLQHIIFIWRQRYWQIFKSALVYFKVLYLKYKFGQIRSNVIASSNLRKTSHISQFEDSEYKYDVRREFLRSNSSLVKCLSHIQILWDQHKNLLSRWLASSSFTCSKFDVKSKIFFHKILSSFLSRAQEKEGGGGREGGNYIFIQISLLISMY